MNKVRYVGEAAQAGNLRDIVAQVAQKPDAALKADLVQVRAEILLGMRMEEPGKVVGMSVEIGRSGFPAELGVRPVLGQLITDRLPQDRLPRTDVLRRVFHKIGHLGKKDTPHLDELPLAQPS